MTYRRSGWKAIATRAIATIEGQNNPFTEVFTAPSTHPIATTTTMYPTVTKTASTPSTIARLRITSMS